MEQMIPGRKIIVCTMKNEGPYLLEWIAYHRSIGVNGFIICSNDCTDATNLMLNRLDALGIINHFDNPQGPKMDPQRSAYGIAKRSGLMEKAEWAAVIDADEFINIHAGDHSLNALLAACPDADAISLNWKMFGSNGEARFSTDLVTKRFTQGSTNDKPENGLVWGFKTLFKPAVFDYMGVHRPRWLKHRELKPGMAKWVNGSGVDMGDKYYAKGWRSGVESYGYALGQINHYAIKSREEFLLKRLRGTANSKNKDRIDTGYWRKYDLNACHDATIHTDGIASELDKLMADTDLAALYRASIDSARRTIAYQLTDPTWAHFVEEGRFHEAAE